MGLIIVVLAAITLVAGGAAPVKADWNKAASDQTLAQVAVASLMMSSRKAPIASPYTYPSQQQLFLPPLEVVGAGRVDGGVLLQIRNNNTGEISDMLISREMVKEATQVSEGWLLMIQGDNMSIPMFIPDSLEQQSPVIRLMIRSVSWSESSTDFNGFDTREFINFFIILSAGAAVIGGSVMGLRIILAYGLGSGYALSQAFQSLLVALVGMGMLMFSEQSVTWLNGLDTGLVETFANIAGIWPIILFLIHIGYVITVLGFGWNSLMITLDALFNASTEPSPVVFQRILAMTIAFLILKFATNIAEYVTHYLI